MLMLYTNSVKVSELNWYDVNRKYTVPLTNNYTTLAKLLARQARPGTTYDESGNKAEIIHPCQQQISIN